MSKNSTLTLERLKEQRRKLESRIQAAEARAKQSHRKQDTRRKILIGSYYLDKAIKENKLNELKILMDEFLTRESDRKLFEFPIKETPKEPQ